MRVCIYRTVNLGASYQAVSLYVANGSSNTNVSSFAFADNNLDKCYQNQFDPNLVQTVLVKKVGDFGWMMADFNMTNYDINLEPQKNLTAIQIQINDILETNVDLEGKIFLENSQPKTSGSGGSPIGDWAKKAGAGGDFIGGDKKSLVNVLTKVGKLEEISSIIKSLQQVGSVLGVLSGLGSLVSMFIGGDNASSFDIKLKGTASLNGTLTLSAPKDNIPILLGQSSANTQIYRSLNNISWGVIGLSKNTDLPVITQAVNREFNFFNNVYTTTGFTINNPMKNPNLSDLNLEDVKVRYIHPDNAVSPPMFSDNFLSLNDFKNSNFQILVRNQYDNGQVQTFGDVPDNIGVQFTLRPTGTTHLLGNKPIVIYKEFKFNRSGTYPNSRISVLENYEEISSSYAYPNPFTDNIKIPIQVSEGTEFQVNIYSVDGREIWKTNDRAINSKSEVEWNGKNKSGLQMPSGTYIVKVISDGKENTHKILLQK